MPGNDAMIRVHASAVAPRVAAAEERIVPKLTWLLVGGMYVLLGRSGQFRSRCETRVGEARGLRWCNVADRSASIAVDDGVALSPGHCARICASSVTTKGGEP